MLWSFLYQASCRSFQLLALRLRSSERNELEILVLWHERSRGRRQNGVWHRWRGRRRWGRRVGF
jgi:hypothetical protein